MRPDEIIFSCSVCQATISDLYRRPKSRYLFNDGISNVESPVTKLWLLECAHLTCGEHLEGGGAPFHRQGDHPRASCPVCTTEKDDSEPRRLFAVNGTKEGEYDPAIPKEWLLTPPIKLDDSKPDSQALRFQYLQLARYGAMVTAKLQNSQSQERDSARKLKSLEAENNAMREEMVRLESVDESLDRANSKLKKWTRREPEIYAHLAI
ncbi:hypothetical protein K402DRAFT_329501, partial [Aulographum hederae CBS 113979]